MRRTIVALMALLLSVGGAFADWDEEGEAREEAARAAARQAEEARQREAERMRQEAKAKADAQALLEKRRYLGAEAQGKSDAEVARLYDARVAERAAEAHRVTAEGRRAVDDPRTQRAVEDVTGHSMKDIQNMSDEELEALSREMEGKYGQ
jgi:Flp pilus assembly protein TadG